jgi:hypothetical protein
MLPSPDPELHTKNCYLCPWTVLLPMSLERTLGNRSLTVTTRNVVNKVLTLQLTECSRRGPEPGVAAV